MLRTLCALAVVTTAAALALPAEPVPVRADPAPAGPAGNWKLSLATRGGGQVIILLSVTEKDGAWSGAVLDTSGDLGVALTVSKVTVAGDVLRFTMSAKGEEGLTFEGVLSKDKKKLNGSLASGGQSQAMTLLPSKLTKLNDPFAIARETLAQVADGPGMFEIALDVLGEAGAKKLPLDEVRGIIDRVTKAAADYGPRWERDTTLKLVEVLTAQEGLSELAVAQAKRAERLLTDDDTVATRMAVLEGIARALAKAGKADEAKPYQAQLAKLEPRDFAEYAKTHPPFKVEPFAGRKGKSDRTAVVELFTGAECPPCVAVDLAFDGLLKAYKPTEAILLEYHLHIPGPDPLVCPDGLDRAKYYDDQIEGTPALFIGGKLGSDSGGPAAAAEKFFKRYCGGIDDLLEKPAGVKLALAVTKGEKGALSAKATVTDLDAPGEKVMLRFVLTEERIRYAGGNGLRYHHHVVRAMPGGAKGVALTKKTAEQTVTIDPDALRAALAKSLDEFEKKAPFPRADRPLALRNLKLVALVQNDATKEILQAVQIELP
jgi:hypothetical protein